MTIVLKGMKKLLISVLLLLILGMLAAEVSANSWFWGGYDSSPYYSSYGYYGYSYYGTYSRPYMLDRALYTVERDPLTRFNLASTNNLYRFVNTNRNFY